MPSVNGDRTSLVRLKAVGDIMLGDHSVCFGHGVRSTIEHHGFDYLFDNVRGQLGDAEIVFGNLEAVLDRKDLGATLEKAEMRGHPKYASDLARTGFTAVSVANNHMMQYGPVAFSHTIDALKENGIAAIGLADRGLSNVQVVESKGVRVAMIGYSLRPEKYWKGTPYYAAVALDEMAEQVARLRRDGHVVVVSLHWGEEFINLCSPQQVTVAHRLVDAGAALILGHHPHVLQGIECYKNAYVLYSLGNFIFDRWQKSQRETIIADCLINRDGVESLRTIPVLIDRQYRPCPLDGVKAERLLHKLDRYSKSVNWPDQLSEEEVRSRYSGLVSRAIWRNRLQSYAYFLRHLHRYDRQIILATVRRFIRRRLDPATP